MTSKTNTPVDMSAASLTDKQKMFVKNYLLDLNATQAAIRAGYSKKTAQRIGSENLSKPLVAAAIQKGQAKAAAKLDFKAEDVLRELGRLAFSNMLDYMTVNEESGLPSIDLSKLTREQAKAIGEFGYDAAGNPKIKLADKRAALVDLGRHFALFTDKTEQTLSINQINVRFHGE